MASYLGLTAVGWDNMFRNWWDKLLGGLLLASIIMGSSFLTFLTYQKVKKVLQTRRKSTTMGAPVAKYFLELEQNRQKLRWQGGLAKEPKTFGVFLGPISNPLSIHQANILEKWDTIVLNPFQDGILDALASSCTSTHILGRLDTSLIVKDDRSSSNDEIIRSLQSVSQALATSFKQPHQPQSPFTGVLLANWRAHFPPQVLNNLLQYIASLGLTVYLELGPPDFLTLDEGRNIDLQLISGVICRNATILPNGDRRDYFDMAGLREAQRALASQRSSAIFYMWETLDDDVDICHADVKRSFNWCRFNSAISWIGLRTALTNSDLACTKTVVGEPLGALMWLKDVRILKAHETWRKNDKICKTSGGHEEIYDSVQSFMPGLKNKLSLFPPEASSNAENSISIESAPKTQHAHSNPFSHSARGQDFTGLGCFQLGLECSSTDFADLVDQQRRLRDAQLLKPIKLEELRLLGEQLKKLCARSNAFSEAFSLTLSRIQVASAAKELSELILSNNDSNRLQIFTGLHSGFRTSLDTQFQGLYDVDGFRNTTLYVSSKVPDLAGTVLHTFLSSRECTRIQCLMTEMILCKQNDSLTKRWNLPSRLVQDIEQLTPTETILFVQRLVSTSDEEHSALSASVRAVCEYQLMDVPTVAELRALNSTAYLRDEVSAETLVTSRIAWYAEKGCHHPNISVAISLFKDIDTRLQEILMDRQAQMLSQLEVVLGTILQKDRIDAGADLFTLAIFCACRKLAISEVYLEILDRNPLPNAHPDQAACYAEMFATGSGCETYFDMTPNVLGQILSDRQQKYYRGHQPPLRDDNATELPTSYASKLADADPDAGEEEMSVYYRVAFLGIFAVPALIDILLLTTIGRGLYLTSFMSKVEKNMATIALMISLLLCGGFGTWISSGASYYLYSMAFPAMNMFVLTRLIAGMAVSLGAGLLALLIITIMKGFYAGIVFLLYFVFLSTYLTLLGTLATYQLPGFLFQSGRRVIMMCVPMLFISPLVTLWVGHDIIIYLSVLGCFVTSLLVGLRHVMAQWGSWYLKVPCVTDSEVISWYVETRKVESSKESLPEDELATSSLPRKALLEAVLKEHNRRFWTKPTEDKLVKKLADQYLATNLLMSWYCKYTRARLPLMYSVTWNLQCNAGIDTLKDIQKGLKLHNAFLHWRNNGDEVWCGVLYFVLALMDKWDALISGGTIVGLSAANSPTYRLAVGFGLASYLLSALALDGIAAPLWATVNKKAPRPISSLAHFRQVEWDDARARRKLYWTTLIKFFVLHFFGVSFSAALMWTFEEARGAVEMYLAYMAAYIGLLWYQYNRVFAGSLALYDLMFAAFLGLMVGPILRHYMPLFDFCGVIALAVSTWTVALLSIRTAKVGMPKPKKENHDFEGENLPIFHYNNIPRFDTGYSQGALMEIFDSVSALPDESRYRVDPSDHPGVQIMSMLMAGDVKTQPRHVQDAFISAKDIPHRIAELWKSGEIIVDLVPARTIAQPEQKLRSISRTTNDRLHIFIFIGIDLTWRKWTSVISRNCKVVAELLLQATTESIFGFSHDHSILAEILATDHHQSGELSLPEGVERQIETSAAVRAKVLKTGDRALLRHLLLGFDCDVEWDNLPETIRCALLKRCFGEACHVSSDQLSWLQSRLCKEESLHILQQISRSNLGASITILVNSFAEGLEADYVYRDEPEPFVSDFEKFVGASAPSDTIEPVKDFIDRFKLPFTRINQTIRTCMKFLVVTLVADPEYQRELDYVMAGKPRVVRLPVTFILNGVWLYCKTLQTALIPLVLLHRNEEVKTLYRSLKGMKTVIEKNRIVVESLTGPSTCFLKAQPDGSNQLHQYSGTLSAEPDNTEKLMAINTYSDRLVLLKRDEYSKKSLVSSFSYEYAQTGQSKGLKIPIQRQCLKGQPENETVQFDARGYVKSGSYIKDKNLVNFQWFYRKDAKFDDELLRAEYVLSHIEIEVSWGVRPLKRADMLDEWIPDTKVIEATFIEGVDIYHSKWTYDHRSHPVIETSLNGFPVTTPPMIEHDWFKVLSKPKKCSFLADNPLFAFSSVKTSFARRLFGLNKQKHRISTSSARNHLWKTWKTSKNIDAVTVRWLDEISLRAAPILKPYWRARDSGRLRTATMYLDANGDAVMARTDLSPEISSWTLLAYKMSDYYSFGQGGDTTINTRNKSTQIRDSDDTLHVLCHDTGTWPNESGGVSACRRDMVNDLKSVKWHVVAENANDFGLPRFQCEKNVQSLTVLPLWGMDFLTPTHGLFENQLDSAVQQRSDTTSAVDIEKNFIPILTTLVRCSRAINVSQADLDEATKALVDLNAYFLHARHWSDVWMSDTVKEKWRELWLTEDMENTRPISEWLDAEHPTLAHLDVALDMWQRYLFVFSVPVPEAIPDIFQASHHFTGASYGVLCKVLRNCSLHVWDHCISWREVTVFLSSAMSFDAPFVCTSLISISRLACSLILTHADVVLPCADFFNPGWEIELGTHQGTLAHRRTFARKIDPVVNGISNMERYEPVKEIKSTKPTVSMLSHVRFVKDIKNAILAADIIVNDWRFDDYRLEIYGDYIKAPAYTVECNEIIAAKSLGKHVFLRGLGAPDKVLEHAWIFLNCSVSEGLPLAMGEAALTGVPVVCTDVGASFRVVTDLATGERFSAVVAPNDSLSLAQAQVKVLALLDEWAAFADDNGEPCPKLTLEPTPEETKQIMDRMYAKVEQRRRLGMMGRANVLNSFSSHRYLREHEQMLWIGKYRAPSHKSKARPWTSQSAKPSWKSGHSSQRRLIDG